MYNSKRSPVFTKPPIQNIHADGGNTIIEGCCTIVVQDLKERDELENLEDEQRVIVLDDKEGKNEEYMWKDGEWVLLFKDGKDGKDGKKGNPFVYEDFTDEQLESLRGPAGKDGKDGRDGECSGSMAIVENEKQLSMLEPEEGDKVYVKDTESEYIFVNNEWKKVGGKEGEKEVHAKDVITDTSLQFISREQKKTITNNRTEIEKIKEILGNSAFDSSGKVMIDVGDELGYLEEKVGETITVENNLLEVVKLLGQIVTVDDINQLDGIRNNVQDQIDALSRIGNFTGSVENKSELQSLLDPGLNDMVIVLEDEDHDGESTIYMHNGNDWEYVGKFNINMDLDAEDIKVKDTTNKFPVSKNVEAALSYLIDKFDDVELSIDNLEECCDNEGSENPEIQGGVIQVDNRRDLPKVGEKNTAYIVDEDETNNKATSLYVWQKDEVTGKGSYALMITATVGGKMQEYQQVTKLGVQAPKTLEMPIPRTQNFLRAPIEVLKFESGKNNVKVYTEYSNDSEDDFFTNDHFIFSSNGFSLDDYVRFEFEDRGEYKEVEIKDKNCIKDAFFSSEIKNSGPGNNSIVAGNIKREGYMGSLTPHEFFTIEKLIEKIGVEIGDNLINNEDFEWNKFYMDGKILFVSSRAIRRGMSWNQLNNAGIVNGDKKIKDNEGNVYKVRLLKGINEDVEYVTSGNLSENFHYSEWNRLLLPMYEKSKDGSWEYPELVESDLPYWGLKKNDDYFGIGGSKDGRSVWCAENYNSIGSDGYARGAAKSLEWYAKAGKNWSGNNMGWMPVLELISKPQPSGKFLIKTSESIGYYSEKGWVEVDGLDFNNSTMEDSSYINEDHFKKLCGKNFSILTNSDVEKIGVLMKPKRSILLADGDLSIKSVDNIDFFRVRYTQKGDADLRMIVSVDEGETWQTYEGGVWEDIEPIEQRVLESGISPGVLENIPSLKWNELRKYSDTIRFGYLINLNEDESDIIVHSLDAQFDMTGEWFSADQGIDYRYSYPNNSTIKVQMLKSGDYKINY